MYVVLGNETETNSIHRMTCFACQAKLTVSTDWYSGYTSDDVAKLANDLDWRRREFHESSNPWFCSKHCAWESPQALYLEDIWNRAPKKVNLLGKIKDFFK